MDLPITDGGLHFLGRVSFAINCKYSFLVDVKGLQSKAFDLGPVEINGFLFGLVLDVELIATLECQ